jgi:glycosyltransferase involved in cell wall biosynthesis
MNTSAAGSLLFLTKYSRKGASSRYRTLQFLPHIERAGFRCDVSPLFGDDYLEYLYEHGRASPVIALKGILRRIAVLWKSGKYDLLIIEKELFPYLPIAVSSLLSRLGVRHIIDYDDAIFHRYDSHPGKLVRYLLRDKIARVMRGAQLVIAGNSYLADYARNSGCRNVAVIPTVVDMGCYPLPSATRAGGGIFTIGWIGSPSTIKYVEPILPALAQVCAEGKARLMLIGPGRCSLPGGYIETLPWSEATEAELLSRCDVGIMPLPDQPWERGKCGLKLIQYMASGLPVVASPVGANTEIVEEGVNGFLATDCASWISALTRLREDPALCARLGNSGRRKAGQFYSLEAMAPRLVRLIENTLNRQETYGQ